MFYVYFSSLFQSVYGFSTLKEALDYAKSMNFMSEIYDEHHTLVAIYDTLNEFTYQNPDFFISDSYIIL